MDYKEQNHIFIFDNVFSEKECSEILDFFNKSEKREGETTYGKSSSMKKTYDCFLESQLQRMFLDRMNILFREIRQKLYILEKYKLYWSQPQVQHYEKEKGFFKPHIDNSFTLNGDQRWLATLTYLNDVEKGGETFFQFQDLEVKPTLGRVVIFPASWNYLHEGKMPISEDKFVITNFASINLYDY